MTIFGLIKAIVNHPLNKDQKLKSVNRFIKWQIGSRLISGYIIYNWVNDSKFLVKKGESGITFNIYVGLHEFTDMAYLLHTLREDDLFVDIGANMGSYTILGCSAIGAKGIAFEPISATYDRLMENIHINHIAGRVQCFNVGVGGKSESLKFTEGSGPMNHVIGPDEKNESSVSVEIVRLDDIITTESPSMIKIDVEGYETLVLKGAMKVLKKDSVHSVIMELNGSGDRYGFDESEILKIMDQLGFKTYSYDPFSRTLVSLNGKNNLNGNTLFIRDIRFVEKMLLNAKKFKVHGKVI